MTGLPDENQPDANAGAPQINIAPPGQLTVKIRSREADAFVILRGELDQLGDGYNSPAGLFFGASLGVVVAVWIAIVTTDLGSNRPYFVAVAVAMTLLTIVLLVNYIRDLMSSNSLVRKITNEERKVQ